MKRKHWRYASPAFLCVILFAPSAHANVGLPLLPLWVWGWGAMFVALLPIIVIEAIVLWVRAGTALWESGISASLGNVTSTVIGIPVAVVFHSALREYVGGKPARVETAWQKFRMVIGHVQYEDGKDRQIPDWMWPSGCLILMVPTFLASWLSESWIAQMLLDGYPKRVLDQAVFEANVVTYGLLTVLLGAVLLREMLLIVSLRRSVQKRRLSKASAHRTQKVPEPAASWRPGSEQALRGIAWLKAKEAEIVRNKLTGTSSGLRDELELDHEKAA